MKRQHLALLVGATAGLLLSLAGIAAYRLFSPPTLAGSTIEGAPELETLTLMGADGKAVGFPDAWRDELVLVFFGFANCTEICPPTMAQLARIHEDLGEPEDMQVVMITVDPHRDTPAVIDAYAKRFHPSFVGLSGDPDAIAEAAETFFVAHVNHGNDVTHSGHVTVLDRQGRIRLVYTQDKMPQLADDMRSLLARRSF